VGFFISKNIIELKKKYNKVYKLKIDIYSIVYRAFNAQEIILLMSTENEEKYKYEVTREAIINKDEYDKIGEKWPIKEQIYKQIISVSNIGSDEEIIRKKNEIKKDLTDNPIYIMIKAIISLLPNMKMEDLLQCNSDQLLFYVVLGEELTGKTVIQSKGKPNRDIPIASTITKKKSEFTQDQLIDFGMESASNDLVEKLKKHGAEVKPFVAKSKKDMFEE